jgi:hypothetical protein
VIKYLPEKVNEIVNEHIKNIELNLPQFLEAYYVSGSVALGAFHDGKSDIDFIAVIKIKASEMDIDALKKIHNEMHRTHYEATLDGMYLRMDDIESFCDSEIPCLRFNDGVFRGFEVFDLNSVDAFILKKYGITVKGQEVKDLKYSVDFDSLIRKMRDNLNTYWLHWIKACRRFPSLRYIRVFASLKMIEWGVLGVTRQYYTFNERDITSKVQAGEYALKNVTHRWHKIIKESMRIRMNNKKSYYHSVIKRRNDALDYMDYIIQECNKLFELEDDL